MQYEFSAGDLAYAVISEGYRAGGINSGGAAPLLLDLDRCRVHPPGVRGDAERMLARLERSLGKHGRRAGRTILASARRSLAEAVRAGATA